MGELKISDYLGRGLKIQSVFSFKLVGITKYRGLTVFEETPLKKIINFPFSRYKGNSEMFTKNLVRC